MRRVGALMLLSLLSVAAGAAAENRTYDGAVTCKAHALLATNADDAKSKAALKAVEAEIDKKVAAGKTREQADADVEYARFDLKDNGIPQATIDAEWTKCVARWGAP